MTVVRIVIDTNIIVSSFLKPESAPWRIVDLVKKGDVIPLLDSRILYEYRDVLHRKKFGFPSPAIDELLSYLDRFGEFIVARPLNVTIPDPDDLPFLEVALSGKADALVTGNKKDFGRAPRNLQILSPAEFIKMTPKFYV